MASSSSFLPCRSLVLIIALMVSSRVQAGYSGDSYGGGGSGNSKKLQQQWNYAHATFYGDETAQSTMGGACGYGNCYDNGYGTNTAALSEVLFQNGAACGQCYEIRCDGSKYCYRGNPSVIITATNLCPCNWALPSDNGGWCNSPRVHFDMTKPAFMQIADWVGGIVPVMYRRVPCQVNGGVKFLLTGNAYWLLVFVYNIGGAGDIAQMWVKGEQTDWICMTKNWGASYQAMSSLGGQCLSFKIQTYTTQETMIFDYVVPANWYTGCTYQASKNFY